MFALLQLHPPPESIPYTGWVARRDYSRKRSSATDAAAAGAAAAKAADGTKVGLRQRIEQRSRVCNEFGLICLSVQTLAAVARIA